MDIKSIWHTISHNNNIKSIMGGGRSTTEYITPTIYVSADPNLLKSLKDME